MTKPLLVGLSERYGYDALGFIVAPPGKTITTATPIRLYEADKEHVERLRRLLIERLFCVNRWGGEVTMYSKPMSVGVHSILVALLAAARARKAGLDEEAIAEHEAAGAIHDIGEALGLGDVPGPLLAAHPAIEAVRQEHQRMASALFPAAAPFTVGARIVAGIDKGIRVWERLWFYPASYAIDVDGNPVALQAFGTIVRSLPVKDWIEGRRIDEAVDLLLSLALGNGPVITAGGSIESSQPITVVVGAAPAPHASLMASYDRFCEDFDFESCECEEVNGGVLWRVNGLYGDVPANVAITLYRTGKATTGGKETPQRAAVRRWLEEQGFRVSC